MKKSIAGMFVLCFVLTSFCQYGHAGEFTRIGAEKGGNETGDIPPYTGSKGLKCPDGWEPGDYLPNPYADEKVLFRIDHTNVGKYKDKLTPGQVARLKKAHHLYMNIYPSHRNFEMPEVYLAASEKNVNTARLDDKNVLQDYNGGVPFPYPKNGLEAAWNTKSAWGGPDFIATGGCTRTVSPKGKVKKTMSDTKCIIMDKNFRLQGEDIPNPDEISSMLIMVMTYPPDQEGTSGLVISYVDDNRKANAWMYMPALRRVRRVPSTDSGFQMDGETIDAEIGVGISAPINDWNWKLIGKEEKYILANNFEMWKVDAKDSDELVTWGINPELLRYELHRVWVIEATPTEATKNHPYGKKVGYFDEDTWNMTLDDRYDRRGNLWRMGESAQNYRYCDQYRNQASVIMVNLETGRYEVSGGCRTKNSKMSIINVGLKQKEFTPQVLKKLGR